MGFGHVFITFTRLDKYKLFKRFLHIIFIRTMLVSQGAEAFASNKMPCAQEHMMMHNMVELDTQSSPDTKITMHAGAMDGFVMDSLAMDSGDMNCCANDCSCPTGLLLVAVLIEDGLASATNFTDMKVASFVQVFTNIFPSQLQRPPKHLTV